MMRFLPLILSALLAGPAMGFELPWSKPDPAPEPEQIHPVVSVILSDEAARNRAIPGVIAAETEATLAFQTIGRLVARDVDLGDRVEQGEVVAHMDPDDFQDNVRAARAAAQSAEVALETARSTAARTRELAARNVASTAQLEQAERGLKSAEAAAEQARSQLARAEDAAGFAELQAPFGGIVSAVHANPGAVVGAGAPVVTLSALDTREAVIDLTEPVLATLPEDPVFEILYDAEAELVTRAKIARIDPMADSATRTRRVYLKLDDAGDLRLGTLVRARLADTTGARLTLPPQAVLHEGEARFVWLVERDSPDAPTGKVRRHQITTGPTLDDTVTVTEGLSLGQEVVVRGVNSLKDGQIVGRSVRP